MPDRPTSSTPPLRGRRGRDRRIGEQVAAEFAARHAPPADGRRRDFDVAEVDAEVDDARATRDAEARRPRPAGRAAEATQPRPPPTRRTGAGHRLPDLSALPPLLAATGSFEALRERLGHAGRRSAGVGRHAGLVAVPHGAKSYLAAALAQRDRERLVWIARDAEIGDRVAEELGAWLGDPAAVVVLEPRTALAYERSELVADETAARVAALAAWRSGRARVLVASVQALLQHTIAPDDLPATPRELRVGARLHQDALLHDLFDLGYAPVTEVAGRGEFARRGGIVDVFPPSMAAADPHRVLRRRDRFAARLRPDRPADDRDGRPHRPAARVGVPAAGGGRGRHPRATRPGRGPARRSGSPATSPGSRASSERPAPAGAAPRPPRGRGPSRSAMRPRSGPPTSRRRPASTTSVRARSCSSTSRATSPRPPHSCGARPTSDARS